MTVEQIEIQAIAVVVSAACAVPGVFLVLRKMAMMSDAISHAILPGIVLAFFLTHDLNSPLLILGAALTGILTVFLVESILRTRLLKEDAAIGLVFPILFSIGVVLIARFAADVHLDTDAVLLGELAFAPFDRWIVLGTDVGPKALWMMSAILVLNTVFIIAFYKELKLSTFDAGLAAALGFLPGVMHYVLMTLVSITAVGAFDAVGSILVVALMIGPPAAAYLLTDRLSLMIILSIAIGIVSALGGYWMSYLLDASIAGCMATAVGMVFTAVLLAAPDKGVVSVLRRRWRQQWTFAEKMLAIHLRHHEGLPEARRENRAAHLQEHLGWAPDFSERVVRFAERDGLLRRRGEYLILTDAGRELAAEAIVQN